MKMCLPHWDMLSERIKASEVGGLVAQTGKDLAIKNGDDPLMYAQAMISMNFVSMLNEVAGMEMEQIQDLVNDSGTCPICWTNERCECPAENCADNWVEYATEMAEERFKVVLN